MTKTVKQLVDEYQDRLKNVQWEQLIFETNHGKDTEYFNTVRNVYKDKDNMDELSLDTEYHEYQLEMRVNESVVFGRGPHWEQVTFWGMLVRYSKVIEGQYQ